MNLKDNITMVVKSDREEKEAQDNRVYKSLDITLYGKLVEIVKKDKCVLIYLEGKGGSKWRAFLNSKVDYSNLLNKQVTCLGDASRRVITDDRDRVLGFSINYNIYKIKEAKKWE